ncbi:unnamed protein product [Acanthosepion pharaonis]|uniref:Uncharacterized protein n=1 Tax=Acanthosepion pharaonis TaxID=158019 RepID=A0A812BMC2_ACAPH|nr:unnamed protein product [Sepia pharaonis]
MEAGSAQKQEVFKVVRTLPVCLTKEALRLTKLTNRKNYFLFLKTASLFNSFIISSFVSCLLFVFFLLPIWVLCYCFSFFFYSDYLIRMFCKCRWFFHSCFILCVVHYLFNIILPTFFFFLFFHTFFLPFSTNFISFLFSFRLTFFFLYVVFLFLFSLLYFFMSLLKPLISFSFH